MWEEDIKNIFFGINENKKKLYHQTGRLGTCGANRGRVPQPRGVQMKFLFHLGVPGNSQDMKLMLE